MFNKKGQTEDEFLANYDASRYERPSVSVDILVFTVTDGPADNYRKLPEKELRLLLVKRGDHPHLGKWALPGGFVKMDENLDKAALRELKEETNVDNIYLEQLFSWGEVGRDPRTRVISVSYMSLVDSSALDIRANDDAEDARWFTVSLKLFREQRTETKTGYRHESLYKLKLTGGEDTLEAVIRKVTEKADHSIKTYREVIEGEGLAFDHGEMIEYGLERLRSKIEYTPVGFYLMPELFTLTELQQVYEVILGKELLKANFRRKIQDRVTETNQYRKDAGHRPSKLFRFNADPWEE